MLLSTAISLLFLLWILILLADYYFRNSYSTRYVRFLEDNGISITPFQFRFYLKTFDHQTLNLAHILSKSVDRFTQNSIRSRILILWFTFGAFVALICFLITPFYLIRLLIFELSSVFYTQNLTTIQSEKISHISPTLTTNPHSLLSIPLHEHVNAGITPIFPGVNLPFSHLPIFILVLIISSVVHEAGHALAAANSNVRVTGLGIFLFAIYPGAFTEIHNDELDRCTYAQKLRIYGAGIWHNIILAIFGVFLLVSMPFLFSPMFSREFGVIVTDVNPKSGLFGPNALKSGDHIMQINQCNVRHNSDWMNCFSKIRSDDSIGFLAQYKAVLQMTASSNHVLMQPDGEVQCCGEFNVTASTHICFRYLIPNPQQRNSKDESTLLLTKTTTPRLIFPNFPDFGAEFGMHPRRANLKMHIPPTKENINNDRQKPKISINFAKKTTTVQTANIPSQRRQVSHACLPAMQITEHALCEALNPNVDLTATLPPGYVCVVPALYNDTVLLRFQLRNQQRPVLFIGYFNEPLHMVDISEFTPRFNFIPWYLPTIVELFARYLITLSLAMGILNGVPCYGLDGQFVSSTVVDYFCQNYSMSFKKRVDKFIMISGTILFCSNMLIGFIKAFFI